MRTKTPLHYLQRIAVLLTIVVGGVLAWEHVNTHRPADATYRAAADAFDARNWSRAHDLFSQVVSDADLSLAARRGQANSLALLGRLDEAHAMLNDIIDDEPGNACNYATRGIVADHLGRHRAAMADYTQAVASCDAAVHGMSWFQRLLTNTHERPPTIAARLNYLRGQMALPASERVLRIPKKDRAQKPWTT